MREAKAIAKLSHPNVVGIFDVGVHEGQVFLAMEYLGGGTLRDWMDAKKRPWREIVKMFIEVGQGLAAAHAEGLIHRDFKPDNVLLDKDGQAQGRRLRAGAAAVDGLDRSPRPIDRRRPPIPTSSPRRTSSPCPSPRPRSPRSPAPAPSPARPRTWRPSSSWASRSTRAPISSRSASRCTRRCTASGRSRARR